MTRLNNQNRPSSARSLIQLSKPLSPRLRNQQSRPQSPRLIIQPISSSRLRNQQTRHQSPRSIIPPTSFSALTITEYNRIMLLNYINKNPEENNIRTYFQEILTHSNDMNILLNDTIIRDLNPLFNSN
jgi:hypothetical protein